MEQKILLPKSHKVLKAIAWLALVLTLSFFTRQLSAQDLCKPIGWATQNGGVTGGGNATPVVVSNYAALKDALTDKNVKVVHVSGTITFPSNGRITIQDQSNKTIFGLSGSKIISTDMSSGGSGLLYVKRVDNLIIRNMYFEGPGAYDNDGNDNLTVDDSRNVWVDHCEFHDGMDGNFDIKNKADFISVTWCTFSYEKPPRSGGSGGSSDHRYTNLIGSSDGATADEGKLRVTFQYCWWGEGCRERMPRVRYGKVDLVNNYYSSSVANQGVRAGYKADIRVEGNYFIDGYSKPIDEFDKDYTAIYSNNNTGASNMTKGSAFTRPYSIAIASASSIVTPIRTCAGAKLASPTACSSCGGGVVTPTNNPPSVFITSPADNQQFNTSPSTITITANANDSDGSVTKVEFYQGATKLGEDNTNPYTYTWSGVTSGSYTLTAKATDDKGATTTSSSIAITVKNTQTTDCNGVVGGSAYLDACAECVGGNTGKIACEPTCEDIGVKFGMVGYATMDGGTTGGAGGDEVTVSTGTALQDAISNATGPRIIYVNGIINLSNSGSLSKIDIKDVSDISIIGVGTSGELDGIGLKIWRASNIIIQNLKIYKVLSGDKDGLNIEGPSDHIWVDHCEFFNEFHGVGKDYYDALLDAKRDVDYVTISWNYFHDSWKASLAGSSESDTYNRTITYHHNFYENINSRLPLFRSGFGHVFNNYYKDIAETTINSRINACVKIENNYFLNANNPYVTAYSDIDGYGDVSGNILVNSPFTYTSDERELPSCTSNIPYNYSGYLNCAENVPSIVSNYSGVGKLDAPINQPPTVSITAPTTNSTFEAPAAFTIQANAADSDGSIAKVEFYQGENLLNSDNTSPYAFDVAGLAEGTYTITAKATDNQGAVSTSAPITIEVTAPSNADCNGVENGSAYLDNCSVCVGGNTGFEPCVGDVQGEAACSVDGIQLESTNTGFLGEWICEYREHLRCSSIMGVELNHSTTSNHFFPICKWWR